MNYTAEEINEVLTKNAQWMMETTNAVAFIINGKVYTRAGFGSNGAVPSSLGDKAQDKE